MKHLPRDIRMDRERKRLEDLAEQRGFKSAGEMLQHMYEVEQVPIQKIADTLVTPIWTLRKRFDELGIQVRTRGGRNYVKVDITPELLQELARDGVPAVAERLGVEPEALYIRLKDIQQ